MRRIVAAVMLAASIATVTGCESKPAPVSEQVQKYYDENVNKVATPPPSVAPPALRPVPAGAPVLFLGDSYTEGYGTTNMADDSFAQVLTRAHRWDATVDAVGGTGFINGGAAGGGDYRSRIEKLAAKNLHPALIFIEGGLNDSSDTSPEIWAAVDGTVKLAHQKWPDAQIVVIGPSAGYPANQTLPDGVAAVRKGASINNVPFIDVSHIVNSVNNKDLAFRDGYHLTTEGHKAMAALIDSELAKLTR